MEKQFFADSLFVAYVNGVPSNERIPYVRGEALTQETVHRLMGQILSGSVRSVQLDDEPRENSLVADFRDGWSTVYIVKNCEDYFEFVNDGCPTCETPLNITGDGPTPQKHATEDVGLMAEIISHFLQTGEIYPNCAWEHTCGADAEA